MEIYRKIDGKIERGKGKGKTEAEFQLLKAKVKRLLESEEDQQAEYAGHFLQEAHI
jgi:hypothetical protein